MNHARPPEQEPESLGDFRLADLCVFPAAGRIEGPGGAEQVDPIVMAVFELLARNAGELVSRDVLLDSVWEGRIVSDDVISRCIYQLRRHLARAAGHRAHRKVTKTLPKRGYLLDAAILPIDQAPSTPVPTRLRGSLLAAAIVMLVAVVMVSWWLSQPAKIESESPLATTTKPTVAVPGART